MRNLFLVGPMGSGKTAVGKSVARLLRLQFVDSDAEIERRTGVDITYIFEREGEAGFRQREREIIAELTQRKRCLLSTGGGAVIAEANRSVLRERGFVVYLHTSVEEQAERTAHGQHRPLLANVANPAQRLAELMAFREPLYRGVAHAVVNTDRRKVQSVADDVAAAYRAAVFDAVNWGAGEPAVNPQRLDVVLPGATYPIHIGPGMLDDATAWCSQMPSGPLLVVTNPTVAPLYLDRLLAALQAAMPGRRVHTCIVPDGEQHKSLGTLSLVFDALVKHRISRDGGLVALGGGVIGDLTGFAAATWQRGVACVQVPTTLLAQVDSSVGGKTAVNHPGGKNLIGAFHQPSAVIADTATLATLPPREFAAGLAEVAKYGFIMDEAFIGWMETNAAQLRARDPVALAYAIRRSCECKAHLVAIDEREQGPRALLNLGHTFGHAIETGAGYGEYLHGEAVAIGIVLAAGLSQRLGWLSAADVQRVCSLLEALGLPIAAPKLGVERTLELMRLDKKVLKGQLRLVLLRRLGQGVITADYPEDALLAELQAAVA